MSKTLLKDLFALLGVLFFSFVFFGSYLVYTETGRFGFHWTTLRYILGEHIHYLLLAIVFLAISIFLVVSYFRWAMSQRKNCQIQYVDLSQIAQLWLEQEEVEVTIREKVETEFNDNSKAVAAMDSTPNEITERVLELTSPPCREFVKTHILPFAGKLDRYEGRIIFDILRFLEEEGGIPSVASMYKNDPEIQTYSQKSVTLSGKTSYEVLSEYTLLDHTLRVAKIAAEFHGKNSDVGKGILYGRLMVAALSHDIGKVVVKDSTIRIKGEMYHNTPHDHISAMMFRELYPDYPHLATISDAIKSHHIPKAVGTIAELLKTADKAAREEEIKLWLIRNKEATQVQIEASKEKVQEFLPQEWKEDSLPTDKDENAPVAELPKEPLKAGEPQKGKSVEDKPSRFGQEAKRPKKEAAKGNGDSKGTRTGISGVHYDFLEAHGDELIQRLNRLANTTIKSGAVEEVDIASVSFGDLILFNYLTFKNALQEIMGMAIQKDAMNDIYRQLAEEGIIKTINVDSGFVVSTFMVETPSGTEQKSFVPVSCEKIGFTVHEAAEAKRLHPLLRSVNIQSYSKK